MLALSGPSLKGDVWESHAVGSESLWRPREGGLEGASAMEFKATQICPNDKPSRHHRDMFFLDFVSFSEFSEFE